MSSKRVVLLVCSLICLLVATSPALFSQNTSTGAVSGTVTDPTGGAIAAAEVTLTDTSTNASRTASTNETGRYFFADVQPGTYNVSMSKAGFRVAKLVNQNVTVATTLTLNVALEIGSVAETVEVTVTTGAELQTTNSTVGTTIQHEELMQLPNLGRDATTFATLQPGTNVLGNTAGAADDQNTFMLDGGSITDDMSGDSNGYVPSFVSDTGGTGTYHSNAAPIGGGYNSAPSGMIPTPVESIEEFKVGVANQTADFNGGAGGQIQMITKRGTDSIHGSVYEYYTDNNFGGANTWDNNSTNTPQPSAHYSRFGASAGGPIIPFKILGGKTYLFGNYEGFRYPLSQSFEKSFPTPLLRSGMMFLSGQLVNLNPTATAVPAGMPASVYTAIGATAGQMIPTTQCSAGACDPRNLGLNPTISQLWNTYLPMPNDYTQGDGINYAGYKGIISLPQTSNFGVVRLDHDFGQKWHLNSTYHYYKLARETTNQVDVGGFFPGDTLGKYTSTSNRPQVPWFYTVGLTTSISPTLTNDFHYSGTRNWWAYATNGGVPNAAGFPADLEVGGETSGNPGTSNPSFQPYNTDNQDTRTRYWNGHDNLFRDDLTKIRGNHLFTFGGSYQRNHETHLRIDNGGAINTYEQYLIGQGIGTTTSGVNMANYTPAAIAGTGSQAEYDNFYSEILGLVDESQILYTRSTGSTLSLNPRSSCALSSIAATAGCSISPPAINSSIIPTYTEYFSDSWHLKPSFTLTYGLSYTIEMPPYEPQGHQDIVVDQNGNQLNVAQYFAARQAAALQGISYDPNIGFATIGNVKGHPKYPYNPYYDGFSPRLSAAWNPKFDSGLLGHIFGNGKTVIRGGYARIDGRVNGVAQVLVPILSPGLMQTVQCFGPTKAGACGGDPTNVFRVGVDGTNAPLAAASQNLPQPWYPGVNDVASGSGEGLDPSFKPDRSDEFNLNVQRQLSQKIQVEVGFIGRRIRNELQAYDMGAVPYMMTMGGQTFANAWGKLMLQTNSGKNVGTVPAQPFFEAALNPAYCVGFANCTTAFLMKENGNMSCSCVWDAWNDVSSANDWTFGRSLLNSPIAGSAFGANGQGTDVALDASNGYGNYFAGYLSFTFSNWHGMTMKSNYTYGKALGTGSPVQATSQFTVVDPYNLHNMYGVQPFDERQSFNLYLNYQLPFYKNQQGIIGRILGGWSVSPLFVAGSGFPVEVGTANGNCESFGEGNCANIFTLENGVALGPLNYSPSRHQGISGSGGVGTAGAGQNVFTNPQAAFNLFRSPILGVDGQIGGGGPVYGLPFWNLDMALNKNLKLTERFSTSIYFASTNVLNHMQPADPCLNLYSPSTFGVLGCGGNVQANTPRRMEFGLRVVF
jgi:hypothetical protein